MQISKTTLAAIVAVLTALVAHFGLDVSQDTLNIIVIAAIGVIGKFASDDNSDYSSPQAFLGSFASAFGTSTLILIVPGLLQEVGSWVIKKDGATKGWKTAAGNLIKAFGPVVAAVSQGSESAFKKALRAVRDTIDNYLAPIDASEDSVSIGR